MARKTIVWSLRARLELRNILTYYTQRNKSPNYSLKLLNEIDDLLVTLSQSEFIGRLTSNKKTRVVVMKVYLVFYEVSKNRIEILSFWDNRQNEVNRLI